MEQSLLKNSFEIVIQSSSQTERFLTFKKRRYYKLKQLLEETCPQLVSKEFIQKNKKQLSLCIFQFDVRSEDNNWTIFKRIQDFIVLEKILKRRTSNKIMQIPVRKQSHNDRPDLLLDFFEVFLTNCAKYQSVNNQSYFLYFLQIPVTKQQRKLKIYKQCYMKKRSGGRYNQIGCNRCSNIFGNWKKRLFTITSQGIYYCIGYEKQNSKVKQMIPFSFHFSFRYGLSDTGYKLGITIQSCQRTLKLQAQGLFEFVTFIFGVKKALKSNDYLQIHRFGSFAQIRENCESKYYIDGEQYFKDIYYAMINSKKQIFITDWMLTPYFLLIRPNHLESQYRLDKVLQKTAQRGVKIFIIIFLEPKMALNNDSEYTKKYLQGLHPNIKVMRHPNYLLIPFLWSHHQKIVIIDQKIGFLGGLDICYGRMDNKEHKLADIQGQIHFWQGADYSNLRQSDIYTPRQYYNSMINRQITPRMPWHDIAIQIRGDSVIDLTRHFVQYWNFVNFQSNLSDKQLLIAAGINRKQIDSVSENNSKKSKEQNRKEFKQNLKRFQSYQDKPLVDNQIVNQKNKPQKYISQVFDVKSELDERQNRTYSFQRIQSQFLDLESLKPNIKEEKEFYENFLKKTQPIQNTSFFPKLQQKLQKLKKYNPINFIVDSDRLKNQNQNQLIVAGNRFHPKGGKQKHQLLRSASTWGLGIQEMNEQKSIYKAYIQLISKAKQFIYIQNQFFISVQNKVTDAIRLKILHAYQNKTKFKIIIIVPLMPAFEGEIDQETSAVLRVQMHLQYETICRGSHSLFEKLSHIPYLEDYIQIYCLRTHEKIKNKPVTEMIYVHSKLMIIDDEIALIGSANINDRSLSGVRDSQIAIVIQDQESVYIKRNDGFTLGKKFAHKLRTQLYMEHFGLQKNEAEDFLNEDIWWTIKQRARKNTLVYRQIFACYPDDEIKSFADLTQFKKKAAPQKYDLLSELIKGHVVEFPRQFLKNQNLKLKPSQKEYYVPQINFT